MEQKILDILYKMDSRLGSMDSRLDNMDSRLGKVETDVSAIKTQQQENTQILRALEHKAEVNKAEHDKILLDLVDISGDVKKLRKDVLQVEMVTANNWSDIVRLKGLV